MNKPSEVLQGTLDLMILRTPELRAMHGVGVAERIRQVTNGVFVVKAGSLFPALHRLEGKGWLESQWGETGEGHRAKFYKLHSRYNAHDLTSTDSRRPGNCFRICA